MTLQNTVQTVTLWEWKGALLVIALEQSGNLECLKWTGTYGYPNDVISVIIETNAEWLD